MRYVGLVNPHTPAHGHMYEDIQRLKIRLENPAGSTLVEDSAHWDRVHTGNQKKKKRKNTRYFLYIWDCFLITFEYQLSLLQEQIVQDSFATSEICIAVHQGV